jgi:hypothetical protein
MHKQRQRHKTVLLDDAAAQRAARLIFSATPSSVAEIIERPETDDRVRAELRRLASAAGKRAA